jgi:hypothetical protein
MSRARCQTMGRVSLPRDLIKLAVSKDRCRSLPRQQGFKQKSMPMSRQDILIEINTKIRDVFRQCLLNCEIECFASPLKSVPNFGSRSRNVRLPGFGPVRVFAKFSEPRTPGQLRFSNFAERRTAPGARCVEVQAGSGTGSNFNEPEFWFFQVLFRADQTLSSYFLPTDRTRVSARLAAAGHKRDIARDARDDQK